MNSFTEYSFILKIWNCYIEQVFPPRQPLLIAAWFCRGMPFDSLIQFWEIKNSSDFDFRLIARSWNNDWILIQSLAEVSTNWKPCSSASFWPSSYDISLLFI